jgi:hypothetical protein
MSVSTVMGASRPRAAHLSLVGLAWSLVALQLMHGAHLVLVEHVRCTVGDVPVHAQPEVELANGSEGTRGAAPSESTELPAFAIAAIHADHEFCTLTCPQRTRAFLAVRHALPGGGHLCTNAPGVVARTAAAAGLSLLAVAPKASPPR